MKKRSFALLIALLGLLLAACTRSATTDPVGGSATEDPFVSIFNTMATQTALAGQDKAGTLPTLELSPTPLFGDTATVQPSATPEATATTTPAPITQLAVPSSYTLHEGEWPYCLARRFDVNPDALLSANGLNANNANSLSVGTTITIPSGVGSFGGVRSLRSHPTTYVASGADTFYSIACAFGDVWPEHIAEANSMSLDHAIPGGTQLHIP
ncbi:MAG: LysM peptidoglycan-binding domain-containing protein [Anaerolineales bacterium]|nr:MAG: LysM peptidoglycan-binding domain-containing protein [Anaerolineales bacterium]